MNIVNNRDTATEGNLTIRYTRVVCVCLSLVCCAGASTGTTYDAGLAPPPDVLPKPDIFVRDAKPDDLSLPRARVEYGSIWKEEGETYKVLFNKPGQIARFTNRLTGQKTKLVQFNHRPDYFITAPGTDAMWVYKRCPRPGVYRSQRTGSEYLILTSEELRELKAERRRQDYRHVLNNPTGVSVRTLSRVDQRVSGNTDGITLTGILVTLCTDPDDFTAHNVLCQYIEEHPHDLCYEWLLGLKYLGEILSENETRAQQTIDLLSRHNAASPVLRYVSARALSVRCPRCSGNGRNARGVVCVKCRGTGIAESRSKVIIAAKEMARQIISMYFAEYAPSAVTNIEQGGSLLKTSWVTHVSTSIARSPQEPSLYNQLAMLTAASLVCSNTDWLIAIQSLVDRHNGHRASADAGFQRLSNLFPNSVLLSDTAPTQFYSQCSRCSGKGKSEASCTMCAGSGVCNECRGKKVVTVASGLKGCFMCKGSGKCVACNGTGKLTRTCKECEGSGRVFHKSVVQAQLNSLATRITRVDLSDVELEYATRRGWGLYAGRWMPINMVSNAVMRDAGYALHQGRWIKRDDLIAQGLVEHEGEWMKPVEMTNRIMTARNMILYEGEWMTPEEKHSRQMKAKGLVLYEGQWLMPMHVTNRMYLAFSDPTTDTHFTYGFENRYDYVTALLKQYNHVIDSRPFGFVQTAPDFPYVYRTLKWGDTISQVRSKLKGELSELPTESMKSVTFENQEVTCKCFFRRTGGLYKIKIRPVCTDNKMLDALVDKYGKVPESNCIKVVSPSHVAIGLHWLSQHTHIVYVSSVTKLNTSAPSVTIRPRKSLERCWRISLKSMMNYTVPELGLRPAFYTNGLYWGQSPDFVQRAFEDKFLTPAKLNGATRLLSGRIGKGLVVDYVFENEKLVACGWSITISQEYELNDYVRALNILLGPSSTYKRPPYPKELSLIDYGIWYPYDNISVRYEICKTSNNMWVLFITFGQRRFLETYNCMELRLLGEQQEKDRYGF